MIVLLCFVFTCVAYTKQTTYTEENSLKILNDQNYLDFVNQNKHALIYFYTPGCGPCENFQPQVEKAASLLIEDGIVLGKLDAETNKEAAKFYSVTGYPTLMWFEDGRNKTKYSGGRTYDAVQMFVYESINPGTTEHKSLEDLRKSIDKNDCIFLFFGDDPKDRTFRKYRDFSYTIGQAKFGHTFVKGAAKYLGLPERTQVAAFKKYDKSPVIFQQKQIKVPELKAFVELNMIPRITTWSEDIEKRITKKDKQALVLFTLNNDEKAEETFQKFAESFPPEDYLLLIKLSPESESWQQVSRRYGVWESQLKDGAKLLMLNKNATQKYMFDKEFKTKNIEDFIYDCRDGKLPQYYRSQEKIQSLPELNYLQILSGNAYLKLMLNSPLDWIVIYYDPSDRNQLEVLKSANRLAQRLQKNENVRFALTDAIQNEYPDFDEQVDLVKIRLYKGSPGKKQHYKFTLKTNKLQEERLNNFIYEHTSYEWIGGKGDL